MKQRGVITKGIIDYPLLKQTVNIELDENDETKIEYMLNDIYEFVEKGCPPDLEKKSYCKKCAYYELCYI